MASPVVGVRQPQISHLLGRLTPILCQGGDPVGVLVDHLGPHPSGFDRAVLRRVTDRPHHIGWIDPERWETDVVMHFATAGAGPYWVVSKATACSPRWTSLSRFQPRSTRWRRLNRSFWDRQRGDDDRADARAELDATAVVLCVAV